MPRPLEREKPLQRVNIMLDCEALENAQRAAALVGVDPSIVGSNSAFIRWLIDEYNKSSIMPKLTSALRHICEKPEFKKAMNESIESNKELKQAISNLSKQKKRKK